MAIQTGVSTSQFPSIDDRAQGVSQLIESGRSRVLDFLTQISSKQRWEQQFVEQGSQNIPGFSTIETSYSHIKKPSRRRIYSQSPKSTILVKKRMFGSLRSNYDVRYMNEQDKVFIRAAKIIFKTKCDLIAYHKSLSTLNSAFDETGFLNIESFADGILDSFLNVTEQSFGLIQAYGPNVRDSLRLFANEPSPLGSPLAALHGFVDVLLTLLDLRDRDRRARASAYTKWVSDPLVPDNTGLGIGSGIIELNEIESYTTSTTLSGGSANLQIQDPYRLMFITETDIEQALRQAISEDQSPSANVALTSKDLLDSANDLDSQLNQSRRNRNLSEFEFNFDAQGSRFTMMVLATGETADIQHVADLVGPQSISSQELVQILAVFQYLGQYLSAQTREVNRFQVINERFNDVRQRLRNEFVGQLMLQQMDQIYIFANSETRDSSSGQIQSQNITDLYNNYLNFQQESLDASTIEMEHQEIAPNIPLAIYLALRDRSVFRSDGVQVWEGLIDSVSSEYQGSNGTYTVSVGCKDNLEFLQLSSLNVDPSIGQTKGMLYDPVSPFDLKTDAATGLVSTAPKLSTENIQRLKYLRFDDGLNNGDRATDKNIFQDKLVGGNVLSFQHLPGLIYQWKKGIIAETLDVNIQRPLDGRGNTLSDVVDIYGVTVNDTPFAALDAADVVSIMVTGQPYNYANFFKHSLDAGTFSVDTDGSGKSYFNYLFDFLGKQPGFKGNFVPAVPSPIDSAVAAEVFREKAKLEGFNNQLTAKERRLAELQSQQIGGTQEELQQLTASIQALQLEINNLTTDALGPPNPADGDTGRASFNSAGNSFYVNLNGRDLSDVKKTLKYRLKKKSEEVRFNQDQNYFVVSEQYDSDTDIQAFAQNLKGVPAELWRSQYESPSAICRKAADAIGFEFFADSQGNLQFRPPQYNKTPLSLLLKLVALKSTEGIGYAPDFLMSFFKTRVQLIVDQILRIDLQLLENLILLGTPIDLTNPSSGIQIPGGALLSLSIVKVGPLYSVDQNRLADMADQTKVFSFAGQQQLLNNTKSPSIENFPAELIRVRNQFHDLVGRGDLMRDPSSSVDLAAAQTEIERQTNDRAAQINKLNIITTMAQLASDRQLLLKSYTKLATSTTDFSLQDGSSRISDLPIPSSVKNQLAGLTDNAAIIPKFMEALVENDLSNEDGWRSGRRFIIEDDVIISCRTRVATPEFNFVEVLGNADLLKTSDGSLGPIPNKFWAGAVDYDSWRRFGLKTNSQQIFRADFTSSENQCAPYAVFKLQEQRAKINTAELTVMGNEFYQVGDVVYLSMNNMLYYVVSVNHSFEYGSGKFQTSLSLEYGRALGEYIPTSLDIIGKGVIAEARKAVGNIQAVRTQTPVSHAVQLNTFYVPAYNNLFFNGYPGSPSSIGVDDNETRRKQYEAQFYSDASNQTKAASIISVANAQINQSRQGQTRVEVRTYFVAGGEQEALLERRALEVGHWVANLLNGTVTAQSGQDQSILEKIVVKQIQPIDIASSGELSQSDQIFMRYPSGLAWAGENQFAMPDGVGLPLNAIDVVFVAEKGKFGDQSPEQLDDTNVVVG